MLRIIFINFIAVLFLIGGVFGILQKDKLSKQVGLLRFPIAYLLFVHTWELARKRKKFDA